MSSNEAKFRSREELLQNLEAAQLRLAFYDLQEKESVYIEKQAQENKEVQQLIDAAEPDMLHLIDREVRKKHLQVFVHKALPLARHAGRVAACILLTAYIGFSAALAVSPTVRIKAMELLISVTDEYAQIRLEEKTDSDFFVPAEWKGEYYPSYIPDDFVLDQYDGIAGSFFSEYVAASGSILSFTENTSDTTTNIDIEDAEVIHTTIHDSPAIVSVKDGNAIVVWSEFDRYFTITLYGDQDTALRIARSVVRIK